MTRCFILLLISLLPLLTSCGTTDGGDAGGGQGAELRNAAIRAEPRGDWYIGRRYFTNKVRYWGYLRRPGELWETAKLVVMEERRGVLTPDRLPEAPASGNAHGFDHNYEYRVWGHFTGGPLIYDPNSDTELPAFAPTKFELISTRPGFLFSPKDRYNPNYIPARIAKMQSHARM
ncbi:MAG TPA: hypothetical protein VG796_09150 [Verrucomicrobiales bacterium]|jgi:hypothetical protein|nr:hypothetical protein [Verrucomicrobiales bacterium]